MDSIPGSLCPARRRTGRLVVSGELCVFGATGGEMLAGASAGSARALPGCERERRRGLIGEGVDAPELMNSTRGAIAVGAMAASSGDTPL